MSSRARRLTDAVAVQPFIWGAAPASATVNASQSAPHEAHLPLAALDRAAVEREAFAQGYAQGERAGADAAAVRAEALLRKLAATIDELQALRGELIRRTERQLVELALAIAQRIVNREIALDRELLVTMARVALDRLSDAASATIRLHPEDYGAAVARQRDTPERLGVRLVSDPAVSRGGCLVQSALGLIDVSAAAQLHEISVALLGESPAPAEPVIGDVTG